MVDIDLLVDQLKKFGHVVDGVHPVQPNAGDYELVVDGKQLNLEEARAVLEGDQAR